MARLLAARANGELNRYAGGAKNSLAGPVALGSPLEKLTVCDNEELEAWLRTTMPVPKGPHASRPWIKYGLKEITSVKWTA